MELEEGENDEKEGNTSSSSDIKNKESESMEDKERRIKTARDKYDLTCEEIEEILNKSNKHKHKGKNRTIPLNDDGDIEDELNLTMTQKINLLIYGSLILVMVYVLNRDYERVVTMWFVRMFPREAKTLGFEMYVDQ